MTWTVLSKSPPAFALLFAGKDARRLKIIAVAQAPDHEVDLQPEAGHTDWAIQPDRKKQPVFGWGWSRGLQNHGCFDRSTASSSRPMRFAPWVSCTSKSCSWPAVAVKSSTTLAAAAREMASSGMPSCKNISV